MPVTSQSGEMGVRVQGWGLALAVLAAGALTGACADGGAEVVVMGEPSLSCDFSDRQNPTWEEFRDQRLAVLGEARAKVLADPFEQLLAAAPADARAQLMGFLCENPQLGRFGLLADGPSDHPAPLVTFDAALEMCMGKQGLRDENGELFIDEEVVAAAKGFVCPE